MNAANSAANIISGFSNFGLTRRRLRSGKRWEALIERFRKDGKAKLEDTISISAQK